MPCVGGVCVCVCVCKVYIVQGRQTGTQTDRQTKVNEGHALQYLPLLDTSSNHSVTAG